MPSIKFISSEADDAKWLIWGKILWRKGARGSTFPAPNVLVKITDSSILVQRLPQVRTFYAPCTPLTTPYRVVTVAVSDTPRTPFYKNVFDAGGSIYTTEIWLSEVPGVQGAGDTLVETASGFSFIEAHEYAAVRLAEAYKSTFYPLTCSLVAAPEYDGGGTPSSSLPTQVLGSAEFQYSPTDYFGPFPQGDLVGYPGSLTWSNSGYADLYSFPRDIGAASDPPEFYETLTVAVPADVMRVFTTAAPAYPVDNAPGASTVTVEVSTGLGYYYPTGDTGTVLAPYTGTTADLYPEYFSDDALAAWQAYSQLPAVNNPDVFRWGSAWVYAQRAALSAERSRRKTLSTANEDSMLAGVIPAAIMTKLVQEHPWPFFNGEQVTFFCVHVLHSARGDLGMFPHSFDIRDVSALTYSVKFHAAFIFSAGAWVLESATQADIAVGAHPGVWFRSRGAPPVGSVGVYIAQQAERDAHPDWSTTVLFSILDSV